MTNTEIRVAIARYVKKHGGKMPSFMDEYGCEQEGMPNYPESLDAMAEARKTLKTREQKDGFTYELWKLVETRLIGEQHTLDFDTVDSPAPEQAEAFLRCLGLWRKA